MRVKSTIELNAFEESSLKCLLEVDFIFAFLLAAVFSFYRLKLKRKV